MVDIVDGTIFEKKMRYDVVMWSETNRNSTTTKLIDSYIPYQNKIRREKVTNLYIGGDYL